MSQLDELVHRFLHGVATESEKEEIDRLLSSSPEAADLFVRASRLDQSLERLYREEQAIHSIQRRIRGFEHRRLLRWIALAAAALLMALASLFMMGRREPTLLVDGRPWTDLSVPIRGERTLTFPDESTSLVTSPDASLTVETLMPAKRFALHRGSLRAAVAHQNAPMVVTTSQATIRVLGTRFVLTALPNSTRLEVAEGKVRITQGGQGMDVGADEAVETSSGQRLAKSNLYEDRFAALWRELHDPKNGYFSSDGIPYHSVETLIVDAPDYGHLTTSETFSYWLWLEAMHGRSTGDWGPLIAAWKMMERVLIPSSTAQPTNDLYAPQKPASYVPEGDRVQDYPLPLDSTFPVGADPLYHELLTAHGSADLYVMHWLLDVDNFYGYGRQAFVNTFQRGPSESVWSTVPHPSVETFSAGGPHGFLDLFVREPSYAKQWRFTCAPDADARAIQSMFWAARWATEQGKDPSQLLPLKQAARMGDSLRYALRDKYFKTEHDLISWSEAWGGSLDRAGGWAWRSGSSHIHFGYQNPLAAWALANDPLLRSGSPDSAAEWSRSLKRQVEFYRWLQSSEGAIGGGATSSVNGRYERIPPGTAEFHGLAYVDHPVFRDPPSNEWFGWQPWSMGRLAQYARLAHDPAAQEVVDRWAAWARSVVKLGPDGSYSLPATLSWSGQPGVGLHVKASGETPDVGVAAALARALIAHGSRESRAVARELLDRMWARFRDGSGVSNPESRADYRRFNEPVALPPAWHGTLAAGGAIGTGATFLDLRPGYRRDPGFSGLEQAIRSGKPMVFRYHRFWAQVEIALANAEYATLGR